MSLAFSLGDEGGFRWVGEYDITADEMLSGIEPQRETKTQQAKDLICALLAGGKQVLSEDIDKAALERGIPGRTVRDLPNCPDDGSFLGCYNQAWIITEAEAASYERLNRQRQNEKDLAQKAAQDAYNAKTADFETGYENCKKQFESWKVTDVKQKQGDLST